MRKLVSFLLITLHIALGGVKYAPIPDYPAESSSHTIIYPEKGPQDRCITTHFRLITSAGYDLQSEINFGHALVVEPLTLAAGIASELTYYATPTVWLNLFFRTLLFPFHSFL